jgi:predicted MFS family arabinose efflux permease
MGTMGVIPEPVPSRDRPLSVLTEIATVGDQERRATRMLFFIGGISAAAWAALVPFAKSRVGLDDGALGLLLLCLGAGSILAMPTAGALVVRYGCRKVLTVATVILCVALPLLAMVSSFPSLAVTLFIFGAALGSADCAFNIQAVIIETESKRPLMSGFHGFYSLGGIVGAVTVSGVLTLGAKPLIGALTGVALMFTLLAAAYRGLLPYGSVSKGPLLAVPRGIVLFLGALCFVVFLVEGAMLDWSAVFLSEIRGVPSAEAGFGYACFSVAMTLGRLAGDAIVKKLGPRVIVAGGGSLAVLGIILSTVVPSWQISLVGYALIGLGCSNIVPVLFSAAGRQKTMPQALAVPALTTLGYAGILAGPAGIGFIARHSSLAAAFLWLAALMVGVAISSLVLKSAAGK